MSQHHSHPEVINRLKRIHGHVAKIISMIEDQTPCVDVAQQMHAVERAITNAKRTFVEDHIDHCFNEESLSDPRRRKREIKEFKSITKYL